MLQQKIVLWMLFNGNTNTWKEVCFRRRVWWYKQLLVRSAKLQGNWDLSTFAEVPLLYWNVCYLQEEPSSLLRWCSNNWLLQAVGTFGFKETGVYLTRFLQNFKFLGTRELQEFLELSSPKDTLNMEPTTDAHVEGTVLNWTLWGTCAISYLGVT